MQTPDFWSIPFVSGPPVAADVPELLAVVMQRVTGAAPPSPLRYDDDLGDWWSAHGAGARSTAPRSGVPRSHSVCWIRTARESQGQALAGAVALSLPVIALSVDMNGVVVLLPTIGWDLGVTPRSRPRS